MQNALFVESKLFNRIPNLLCMCSFDRDHHIGHCDCSFLFRCAFSGSMKFGNFCGILGCHVDTEEELTLKVKVSGYQR